jgi:hypothetical protein
MIDLLRLPPRSRADELLAALGQTPLAGQRAQDPYVWWQLLTAPQMASPADANSADNPNDEEPPDISLLIELEMPVAVLAGTLLVAGKRFPMWPVFLRPRVPKLPPLKVHSVMTNRAGLLALMLNQGQVVALDGAKVGIVRWELGLARRRREDERDASFINYSTWLNAVYPKGAGQTSSHIPGVSTNSARKPAEVHLCVVDDLCSYAAPDFQSRVPLLWHQGGSERTLRRLDGGGAFGRPIGFHAPITSGGSWIGRLRSLDSLQSGATKGASGSEPEIYRQEGYADPVYRWSHGAAVMALAAGSKHWSGTAAQAPRWVSKGSMAHPLIFVQLPTTTVLDTSGGSLAPNALDALQWALHTAADNQHVVVNMSYGTHAGGHDATSIWDTALQELLDRYDGKSEGARGKTLHLVVPAGNSHLLRCHASGHYHSVGQAQEWRWQVLPDNDEDAFLELWLPEDAGLRWELRVTAPDGIQHVLSAPGATAYWPSLTEHANSQQRVGAAVLWFPKVAQSKRGSMILLAAGPTQRSKGPRASAHLFANDTKDPAPTSLHGVYRVSLTLKAGAPSSCVHLWAQRSDNAPGRGRQQRGHAGRQSRLLETRDTPQGTPIDPRFTLNGIASLRHRRLYVVGAARQMDGSLAAYSSAGPNRLDAGRPDGPDVVVLSDESLNLPGSLVPGLLGSARSRLAGTSIAAARFTRALVQHLEGPTPDAPLGGTCIATPTRELDPPARGSPMRAEPWQRGEWARTALPSD